MTNEVREKIVADATELADDLQRVCLHGNVPLETTMKLAAGVIELNERLAVMKLAAHSLADGVSDDAHARDEADGAGHPDTVLINAVKKRLGRMSLANQSDDDLLSVLSEIYRVAEGEKK